MTGGPAPPRRAFIGLGSNLGDRRALLRAAVEGLEAAGDVVGVSPLYETEPVGGPEGQGPYLNVVVELSTPAVPATGTFSLRATLSWSETAAAG